ncbi:MAG TPA: flagellar basal body P-ring protein FlgI, partial [Phycisphaerales bacterium]|nr:flagellar basal body P-ring protein FlgI [Phycisphaerales bacterium]
PRAQHRGVAHIWNPCVQILLRFRTISALVIGAFLCCAVACDSADKKHAAERPKEVVSRDVPSILRNTIGSETSMKGVEPMLVSGYGVVVGLNGTGSSDTPLAIRSVLEREMTALGVGQGIGPMSDISPTKMLEDPNNAVVLVRAVLQPGSPPGTRFDLLVEALPGTSTTSLEGGRLYTTRLFKGLVRPVMPAVKSVAEGRGELFINPFADPAADSDGTVIRTQGRVLNGGVVNEGLPLTVVLDNPSHSRARAITQAINGRFPRGSELRETARGLNDELIEVNIPREYTDRVNEFLPLLRHTRIDQQFSKEWALRYVRALKEQPELAQDISWSLQALGDVAIPFIRELYTSNEHLPRLAAIQAGARLRDTAVRPHLEDLALKGPPATRVDAYQLMGVLPPDPAVNRFLRDRLDSPDVDARIAAYEALAMRADPVIETTNVEEKFRLDIVPSIEPMVYVTQQKQPKIVIFGVDPKVQRPVFISAWSDRLMLSAQSATDRVNVFYRDHRTGQTMTGAVRPDMREFTTFLAHKPTPENPEPGLDLNYSGVVGALYEIVRAGAVPGVFVPESDRLALEIIRSAQYETGAERPETSPEGALDELPAVDLNKPVQPESPTGPAQPVQPKSTEPAPGSKPKRNYVLPLPQAAPEGKPAKKKP